MPGVRSSICAGPAGRATHPVAARSPSSGDPIRDEEGPGIPMLPMLLEGRFGGSKALEKAVEEAFKGVDMKELEEAWRSTMKKVS